MKAVVQALYRLTFAFGQVLDIMVMSLSSTFLGSQQLEYIFFACLMVLDMVVLSYFSTKYTYKEERERVEDDEDENDEAAAPVKKAKIIIAINAPT